MTEAGLVFTVSGEQMKKICKWEKREDKKVAKSQGTKDPYYGAIGGSTTYCFTPTSIGTVLKIRHSSGDVLDVSDYKNW